MHVTSYTATNTPETFNECGNSFTINSFGLKVGAIQGTSVSLITYMHLDGVENGQSESFTIKLTWIQAT